MTDKSVVEQQLASERASAHSEDAKRAAEKRAAAAAAADVNREAEPAKAKARKQTTRG